MTANNDSHVRIFDTEKFALLRCFSFPWSVNVSIPLAYPLPPLTYIFIIWCFRILILVFCVQNTSVSPDGKLLGILGDNTDCLIADAISGKVSNIYALLQLIVTYLNFWNAPLKSIFKLYRELKPSKGTWTIPLLPHGTQMEGSWPLGTRIQPAGYGM